MAQVTTKFAVGAVLAAVACQASATDSATTTVTLSNLTMQLQGSTGHPPNIVFDAGRTDFGFFVGPGFGADQFPTLFAQQSDSVAYPWGTASASIVGDPLQATATVVSQTSAIADPGAFYLLANSDIDTRATFTLSPFSEVTFSGTLTVTGDVTNPVGQTSGIADFAFLGQPRNNQVFEFRLSAASEPGSGHASQTEFISGGVVNVTDAPQTWFFELSLGAIASVNSAPEPPTGLLLLIGAAVLPWWRRPLSPRRRHDAATTG